MNAVAKHFRMRVVRRPQDERAVAALDGPIEVLLQQPPDGFCREHLMGQRAREQIFAYQMLVFAADQVLVVDKPSHVARRELPWPVLRQDIEHVGE